MLIFSTHISYLYCLHELLEQSHPLNFLCDCVEKRILGKTRTDLHNTYQYKGDKML